MTRLLGVDLGSRRIGLAVGDDATGSVFQLATIRRVDLERDARTITTVATEQRINELVVGLPLNMDGTEGSQAAQTREWANGVADLAGLPLSLRDERLTTEDAISRAGSPARGKSGGPPSSRARQSHRARLDRLAAVAIVQAELDARLTKADTVGVEGEP